ncbi:MULTISPECIES: hypothetical protein [unclassified Brevundimonas]|uniref:hypothetical protein n=1 Tax=unclassified Brevundimonas TaxID=2622653 RepID=UPI0006FC0A4D|nr:MULTISPECIES: hypothetical protein [unclassified Brevundimonas]KQY83565.1 hypothetical protein ASD25_24670 [Brevundimonas sp. Root1423]KRA26385.1 hypothetical protein ASD59_07780 [Brevundimonas sp. Root608]
MLAIVFAVMLQQAAAGQVVWEEPPPPPPAAPVGIPAIPDSARADPYGYERAECSPLIRKASESMEACQARVRTALAANLGADLPPGLAPAGAPDAGRLAAAGDRYALQCGAPDRPARAALAPQEQTCETRPQARPQGGVAWTEECRPADGRAPTQDGLRVRLGGD